MGKLMVAPSLGHPGGAGFGQKDESDNLDDMNYAEQFICNKSTIEMLAQLGILTDKNKNEYVYLTTNVAELSDLGYEAVGLGSAMQRINSVFAALRIPFLALTYTSKDVEAKKKVVKRGKDIGKEKSVKEADYIKIFRYAEEFDPKRYATIEAGRVSTKDNTIIDHETPTIGVTLRTDKWLQEIAIEEIDDMILEAVGFEVK